MITYPPGPPPVWARTSAELAEIYRLRVVWAWTMASLGEQCVVFEVPPGRSVEDLVRRLAADRRVGSAQAIATFETLAQGGPGGPGGRTDPYAHLQHSAQALRLDQAHRLATGKGVRIALVDTGVDFDHPDLRDRVVGAKSFVDRGEQSFTTDFHGTAVAGVIAATANNDVGIAGVAPGAKLYALKACWQQPPAAREAVCNSYTLAKAVDFAIVQGAQVLNFSLGGPPDPLIGRLIGHALSKGIVVVAADGGPSRDFPASYQGVIGIRGSDDRKAGPAAPAAASGALPPKLTAPAVDILTTVPKGLLRLLLRQLARRRPGLRHRRPAVGEGPQGLSGPAGRDHPQDRPALEPHPRRPGRRLRGRGQPGGRRRVRVERRHPSRPLLS